MKRFTCVPFNSESNFLILDETTNDLDIVTLNVLESFLLDYPGCTAEYRMTAILWIKL
jgi:ATP-binding cassette subfamily F protein uup